MAKRTVRGPCNGKMVLPTKAIFKTTCLTDTVKCSSKITKLIKENSKTDCSKGKVSTWTRGEASSKGSTSRARKTDQASMSGKTNNRSKDIGRKELDKEKVVYEQLEGRSTKLDGRETK